MGKWSVGRWVSGPCVGGSVVGGSVVGGFNKTRKNSFISAIISMIHQI